MIGNYIGIGKHRGQSWSSYWTPLTAVVENAAPTDVVLTYDKKVNPADAIAGNFPIAGKTISSATLDATGKILTLTVTVAFVYGDSITVVANSTNISVTNNVLMEAEAIALIARMTAASETPDAARQIVINTTISRLKAAGLWVKLDCLWMMAAHGEASSKMNWISDAHNLTEESGVVTFGTDVGFTGVLANTSYLDTHWISGVDGEKYTQNNASFGISRSTNTNTGILMGKSIGTENSAVGSGVSFINGPATTLLSYSNVIGNIILTRNNADCFLYTNGSLEDSDSVASTALDTTLSSLILARRVAPLGGYSDDTIDFAFYGGYLTGPEVAVLDSILR